MATVERPRYVFGPVPSRRLGRSLGVDVVSMKTCVFNCLYCQLGRTTYQTITRAEYVPVVEVMAELEAFLEHGGQADHITFSGSGEPTLHSRLGEMIAHTKHLTEIPLAVLTCGALLHEPEVRRDLLAADVVLPSLDAALPKTFQEINRPHGRLHLAQMIEGLKQFRREYRGQIWLEIMFVKGINDGAEEVRLLRQAVLEIAPDKVHLNTVVRPPAESAAQPLAPAELQAIAGLLGPSAEVIAERQSLPKLATDKHLVPELLNLMARHPVTLPDIGEYFNCNQEIIWWLLNSLIDEGMVEVRYHRGRKFYTTRAPVTHSAAKTEAVAAVLQEEL